MQFLPKNLHTFFRSVALLLLLSVLPAALFAQRAGLVYQSTFDDGKVTKPVVVQACCSYSQVFESDTTRFNTGKAYHFHLNNTDPITFTSKRSEISASALTQADGWYGYSMFIPHTYVSDTIKDIITQYHNVLPDTADHPSTVPLSFSVQNDHYWVQVQWSATNDGYTHDGIYLQDLGPVTKDVWTDIVWHVKWSFLSDGIVQVWKNGVLVVNRTGPNCYNDGRRPYFKCGEYKGAWKHHFTAGITSRDIYFDDLRIAGAGANYNSVKPGLDTMYITSISPTSAPQADTVTINGGYFTGASAVTIGGKPAASFKVVNSTTIKAVVAPESTANYVTVTNNGVTDTLKGFSLLTLTGTISGNATTCKDETPPVVTFTGLYGYPPFTFTYKINNGSSKTITTTGTTYQATVAAPTSTVGTFVYKLVSIKGKNGHVTPLNSSITVNIADTKTSTTNIGICQADLPYTWNGNVYKSGGIHPVHLTSSSGCDSVATLMLKILSNTSKSTVVVNSAQLPYVWNGTSYNTSGTYVAHLTNVAGCDSTATLVLTVHTVSITSINPTSARVGATITIKGVYLAGSSAVDIGGKPATSFTIVNSTTIKAVVASGATANYVTVTSGPVTDTLQGFTLLTNNALSADALNSETLLVSAYPNPSNSAFTLKLLNGDAKNNVSLEVRNLSGKLMYKTNGKASDIYTFGQNFNMGIYVVQIVNGKYTRHIKVIKQE